jgi:hypothetical protein
MIPAVLQPAKRQQPAQEAQEAAEVAEMAMAREV